MINERLMLENRQHFYADIKIDICDFYSLFIFPLTDRLDLKNKGLINSPLFPNLTLLFYDNNTVQGIAAEHIGSSPLSLYF